MIALSLYSDIYKIYIFNLYSIWEIWVSVVSFSLRMRYIL